MIMNGNISLFDLNLDEPKEFIIHEIGNLKLIKKPFIVLNSFPRETIATSIISINGVRTKYINREWESFLIYIKEVGKIAPECQFYKDYKNIANAAKREEKKALNELEGGNYDY